MTGKKSAFLCAVLSALFISSVFINDVNARSTSSHGHGHSGSHSSHHSSGHSISHSKNTQTHAYPSHSGGSTSLSGHGYPASPGHSLSGNSGSSSNHGYPASNTLSGSGSKPGYPSHPSTNFGGSSGSAVPSYITPQKSTLSGSSNSLSGQNYPSSNTQIGSGTQYGSANSGSAVHSYPTSRPNSLSGGASGSSGSGYPTNIQTNFGNQHRPVQYPLPTFSATSGSAVHSYPTTRPNSLSGGGSNSGNKVGSVSYPTSIGFSGNKANGYPTSGSSNTQNTYHNIHHNTNWGSNTQVHHVPRGGHPIVYHNHHYVYNPPTVIHYGTYGTNSINYPVYMGVPPSYVYEYRSSGNRYSNLLTGLALYNLGRMSANSNSHHYHSQYHPQPDEYCKFGIRYGTGMFEEMAIDCRAITYFIYEDQPQTQTHITTNIMNQTTVTTQQMYSNGSLVETRNMQNQNNFGNNMLGTNMQTNVLTQNDNVQMLANGILTPNTQQMNSVTTTTTEVRSVTDHRFAGGPVEIKPDMECYVTRNTRFTNMKKPIPCELLQKYSTSLHNSGAKVKSTLVLILVAFALALYQ